jgi:hypothetical protein
VYFAASFIAIALLTTVHVFNERLMPCNSKMRKALMSLGSGFAIGYLFLHLLPKLSDAQQSLRSATLDGPLGFLDHHAYLLAMTGFFFYFVADQITLLAEEREGRDEFHALAWGVVNFHAGAFAGYCLLVGYLMSGIPPGNYVTLLLFCIAMSLHFIVVDQGLSHRFPELFRSWGRWLFALATLSGWLAGYLIEIPGVVFKALSALFAGALLVNVIQVELRHVTVSLMFYFFIGASGYAVLLLVLESTWRG